MNASILTWEMNFSKEVQVIFYRNKKKTMIDCEGLGDIYEHSEFSTEMRWTMEDRSREPGAGSCSKAFQVE